MCGHMKLQRSKWSNLRSLSRLATGLVVGLLIASANATEYLEKFELALQALKIPPEAAPNYSEFPSDGQVSAKDILSNLDIIDPDKVLRQYMKISNEKVELYSDLIQGSSGSNPIQYSVELSPLKSEDSPDLFNRLEKIASAVKAGAKKPLTGFTVLIDPGHMGDAGIWDEASGKYVSVGGKTVREGQLTLWTAMLVANELTELGALVTLTRTDFVPVAGDFATYNPENEIAQAVYKSSRADWMQKILAKPESQLKKEIVSAPEIIKILDRDRRQHYLQADLDARSDMIDQLKPDLFIDIHFDALELNKLQSRINDVEVYVPGGAMKGEFGTRNGRARLTKHLLDIRRWKQSVVMAKTVVDQISKNLNIPTLKNPFDNGDLNTVMVEDGVLARNLFQTNRSVHGLTMFFECAHYDHVDEFERMSKIDAEAAYEGKTFKYPSRLNSISSAMRDGILQYFRAFQP